jgi:branched-chain amino acid transport system substrate-binding protein
MNLKKICLLAVLATVGFNFVICGAPKEILLGALVPVSGDMAYSGKCVKKALEIAVSDFNEAFAKDEEYHVKLIIEDTETNPAKALEKVKALKEKGVKIIIGPLTSAELAAVKDYVDKEKILVVSYGSTTPALAVPKDFVYRMIPSDILLCKALAKKMLHDKIKVVIQLYRDDIWGKSINKLSDGIFEKDKIDLLDSISYAPNTEDFAGKVAELAKKVAEAGKKYGAKSVAVEVVSFEELSKIISEAAKHKTLASVKWYLSSPLDESAEGFESDKSRIEFAEKTSFSYPMYVYNESEAYEHFCKEMQKEANKKIPVYCFLAYDSLGLAVKVYRECYRSDDLSINKMKKTLETIARFHHGLTGFTSLDKAGDRAFNDYDFYQLKKCCNEYVWVPVLRYFSMTNCCAPLDYKKDIPKEKLDKAEKARVHY